MIAGSWPRLGTSASFISRSTPQPVLPVPKITISGMALNFSPLSFSNLPFSAHFFYLYFMLSFLKRSSDSLLNLFFPDLCAGCNEPLSRGEEILCIRCLFELPETGFHLLKDNPVAQIFTGRVPLNAATACYYFHKNAAIQHIIHRFKYHHRKDVAVYMGRKMGNMLRQSTDFSDVDTIIPIPLHAIKRQLRGYNQSDLLCRGIGEVMHAPVQYDGLRRIIPTETQTKKSRPERWQNVKDAFEVLHPEMISGKHLLLVDDVVTTGATLEACANVLLQIPLVKVSLAALAKADH